MSDMNESNMFVTLFVGVLDMPTGRFRYCNAVHQHVKDAEQSDDLTMIAIKYQRKEQDTKFYRKLSLHNDIRETPKIADFMDDIVGETGIDMGLASSLNLALEEAVVNVMNYAYPKHQTGNIYIEAYAEESHIQFIITDNGIPFDPTKESEPDITAGIEDRNIGGLGIFLVTHLMDKVEYKRENDKNILTLTKLLNNIKE